MDKRFVKLLTNNLNDTIYNIYDTKDFLNDGSLTR